MLTIDRRPRTTSGFLAGPGWTSYCTSKAGLIMVARCLANDYGPRGVRANCVCPGWVRTPMGDEDMDVLGKTRGVDRDGAYALLHEDVPLRRPGEADEIASVVSFLAGPDAAYVNGVALPVDGGDDLRPHRLRSRSPRESPGLPHPWRLDGARARALQG
jgi:NAD(P)-dependent dehydrogenase (short-subunit alcohol dehydrogenase family)